MSRPSYIPGTIDLTNTIGATYIGVAVSTFAGGLACQMAFTYFHSFPKDSLYFKTTVGLISILNIIHSAFIIYAQYFWTVSGWGDVEKINISTVPYPLTFLITGLVAMLVQMAYAYRIYILSNRKPWMPALICLLTWAQMAASFYCTVMATRAGLQSKFGPYFNAAYVWLFGESAADVLITGSLIYLLQSVRDATSFRSTRTIANRLSIITFETNLLTAISCISSGIFLGVRKDGWGPAINFLSVKLFCISLLVTLNARTGMSSLNSGTMHTSSVPKYSQHYELGSRIGKSPPQDMTNAIAVTKEAVSVAYDRDTELEKGGFMDAHLEPLPKGDA